MIPKTGDDVKNEGVTPEMAEAGLDAFFEHFSGDVEISVAITAREMVDGILRAAWRAYDLDGAPYVCEGGGEKGIRDA